MLRRLSIWQRLRKKSRSKKENKTQKTRRNNESPEKSGLFISSAVLLGFIN